MNVVLAENLGATHGDATQMNTRGQANVRLLSAELSRRLLDVHHHVGALTSRNLFRRLAVRVSDMLGVKAAFVARIDGAWTVLGESAAEPRLPSAADAAWGRLDGIVGSGRRDAQVWRHEETVWTIVGLPTRSGLPAFVVLEDDWTRSSQTLLQFAQSLQVDERVFSAGTRPHSGAAAHRLARTLGRTTGLSEVCAVVLRHIVRAVPSRLASFAVVTDEGPLTIMATHGYPVELVEGVRIAPGSGIIGAVYRDRTPLWAPDVAALEPPRRRRSRYRTPSFAAVPVEAGGDVLGVVCVSDRLDDQAYTREDVSRIRALTAPAALALERERARRQAEAFARAAIIDPVSGLYNRRYFHDRLEEELQRARRQRTPVALLMIDIDDFKSINDRFGHMTGDTVIKAVSDILRRSVRKFDLCTRFGGEEFAIVMPGSGLEGAASMAERIRQRIEAFRPDERELSDLRVTASIGLSIAQDLSPRELIVRADNALYAAKRAGKNRVVSAPSGETSRTD